MSVLLSNKGTVHNKNARFVLLNLCSSKWPVAKHREINETEFSQLEKGKMRFMIWRDGAKRCSITRFTIKP